MRLKPVWWIGVVAFLVYGAIIFTTWSIGGVDYLNLAGRDVIVKSIVVPMGLGTIFLIGLLSYVKWWRPVLVEDRPGRPGWVLWVVLLAILGFVAVNALATNWKAIDATHLALLTLACLLIGFNEEVLTRGILVVGLRGSFASEVPVWFCATLLFGLLHLPNGFFGIGLAGATTQVVFTFLLGTGLYIIRRLSGTLLLPIALHAAWDFATFARQASGEGMVLLGTLFQFSSYLLSILLVILVLRADGHRAERASA